MSENGNGRSFSIRSADGTTIAIPPGEYYFNTKARARRMMRNSLSKEARQVYACLELGTMGFQQERAVVQVQQGVQRPMTRADMAVLSGLDENNVRRGLVELETEKLAERRPIDPDLPLQKGNVEIYSWAVPQSAPNGKRGSRATPKLQWAPPSWDPILSFARRCKISLPDDLLGVERDSLIREGEEAARALEKAEKGVRELLERVSALARPKVVVERTEITPERKGDSAAAASPPSVEEHQNGTPEEAPPPHESAASVSVTTPALPNPWDEVRRVIQTMDFTAKTSEVAGFIATCRNAHPGLRPEFLLHVISKWPLKNASSAFRVLASQLPDFLKDPGRLHAWTKHNGAPVRFDECHESDNEQRKQQRRAAFRAKVMADGGQS